MPGSGSFIAIGGVRHGQLTHVPRGRDRIHVAVPRFEFGARRMASVPIEDRIRAACQTVTYRLKEFGLTSTSRRMWYLVLDGLTDQEATALVEAYEAEPEPAVAACPR